MWVHVDRAQEALLGSPLLALIVVIGRGLNGTEVDLLAQAWAGRDTSVLPGPANEFFLRRADCTLAI